MNESMIMLTVEESFEELETSISLLCEELPDDADTSAEEYDHLVNDIEEMCKDDNCRVTDAVLEQELRDVQALISKPESCARTHFTSWLASQCNLPESTDKCEKSLELKIECKVVPNEVLAGNAGNLESMHSSKDFSFTDDDRKTCVAYGLQNSQIKTETNLETDVHNACADGLTIKDKCEHLERPLEFKIECKHEPNEVLASNTGNLESIRSSMDFSVTDDDRKTCVTTNLHVKTESNLEACIQNTGADGLTIKDRVVNAESVALKSCEGASSSKHNIIASTSNSLKVLVNSHEISNVLPKVNLPITANEIQQFSLDSKKTKESTILVVESPASELPTVKLKPLKSSERNSNHDTTELPKLNPPTTANEVQQFSLDIKKTKKESTILVVDSPASELPTVELKPLKSSERNGNLDMMCKEANKQSEDDFDGIEIDFAEMETLDSYMSDTQDHSKNKVPCPKSSGASTSKICSHSKTFKNGVDVKPETKEVIPLTKVSSHAMEVKATQKENDNQDPASAAQSNLKTNEPFVSEDPEENNDNNNPDWHRTRKLATDDERYTAVRKKWKNLTIPDPNLNLTTHNFRSIKFGKLPENPNKRETTRRKRKLSNSESLSNESKRMKMTELTGHLDNHMQKLSAKAEVATDVCTKKYEEKRHRIELNWQNSLNAINFQEQQLNYYNGFQQYPYVQHHMLCLQRNNLNRERDKQLDELTQEHWYQLGSVQNKLTQEMETLEKLKKEIFTFDSFYKGLKYSNGDATEFSETRLKEIKETIDIYEKIENIYKHEN